MGNCCGTESRHLIGESDEPFSLIYYDEPDRIYDRLLGVPFECPHSKIKFLYKLSEHKEDMFLLRDGNLIRINNPGFYTCHKCHTWSTAKIFIARWKFKVYCETQITWSIVKCEISETAECMSFNILQLQYSWAINIILYLPDVTVIMPKTATNGRTKRYHYLVNTIEAGAVGIFSKNDDCVSYMYSDYFALNENGKEVKLQKLSEFRPIYDGREETQINDSITMYNCDYGIIALTKAGAKFISNSTGRKTKAAARQDSHN
jgi:hypothetical protein